MISTSYNMMFMRNDVPFGGGGYIAPNVSQMSPKPELMWHL